MAGHLTEAETGAVLLFAANPTDRALAGWQPLVWYGGGVSFPGFGRIPIPARYGRDWHQAAHDPVVA